MKSIAVKTVMAALLLFCLQTDSAAQTNKSILFIIDSSGSMQEESSGISKLALAVRAVNSILDSDINVDFGLTVFGGEEGSNEVFYSPVPAGDGNRDVIRTELDKLVPAGRSPMAAAIFDGSTYLNPYNNNFVILITDGIENTGGSPVRVLTTLRSKGVINRLFVLGFIENQGDNPLIDQLIYNGNGSYHNIEDVDNLIQEIINLDRINLNVKTTGLLGYRCFITEENGYPAYGSTVVLKDSRGNEIGRSQFWRGIFEDLQPGSYTLSATNSSNTQTAAMEVTAGELSENNFVFNVDIGGFVFRHYILGTNDSRAFGTVTRVYHSSGEAVYTGTTWQDEVVNLPEGVYTIEGTVEGEPPQEQMVTVVKDSIPEVIFRFEMGKGRIAYRCFLDSAQTKVANGTIVRITRLPYNEIAFERNQWRSTSPFLPVGLYNIEGIYKGIGRQEEVSVRADSTADIDFVFNIRQVRFMYRCFRNESKAPATGAVVRILNEAGMVVESNNTWRGTFLLPEGIYTLQADFQGSTIRQTINLFYNNNSSVEEDIFMNR